MKVEIREITPKIAALWMDQNNRGNRPLSRTHAMNLANEMACDRWQMNGDAIRFSRSGKIIDGQHRLAAVVFSGKTIQSLVVRDLLEDAFESIDIGKRRSPGDTLHVKGESNACRLAAALVMIDKYFTSQVEKSVTYSNTEMDELLKKYPEARNHIQPLGPARGIIIPCVLDSCHYLFSQVDRQIADDFTHKITKGLGLEEGTPFFLLRERLLANSLSKGKMSKAYMMALCIKAFNYTRAGKPLKYLRWHQDGKNTQPFPVVQ